jgi:hypothetical protein
VVERCGAEAATSLLCSKYITTILLPVALCYGMIVVLSAHPPFATPDHLGQFTLALTGSWYQRICALTLCRRCSSISLSGP